MPEKFVINKSYNKSRFDKWFKEEVINLPNSLIQKLLRKNQIKVNNKRIKSSFRLSEGDSIPIFNLSKYKPKYFVHTAAISRPMNAHDKNINNSIDVNIIGTCNVVKACSERNIKLVFIGNKAGLLETMQEIENLIKLKKNNIKIICISKNSLTLQKAERSKKFDHFKFKTF